MKRRNFLKLASAAAITPPWMLAQNSGSINLRNCVVVLSPSAGDRESKAAQVLVEEAEKRCGIHWPIQKTKEEKTQVTIYLATRQSAGKLLHRNVVSGPELHGLQEEGFLLRSGQDSDGKWIAVFGANERGLLFGVGKLLRLIDFGRQEAKISVHPLNIVVL